MVEMAQVVVVPVVTRMGAGVAVEAELLVRAMLAVWDQVTTGLEAAAVLAVREVLEIIQVRPMVGLVLQMLFWELIITGAVAVVALVIREWVVMVVLAEVAVVP
jgi:hypothetical protein